MVYVMLADGFEEIEAIEPVDILRRGGVEVKTVSITGKKEVIGAHSITVTADMTVNEVEPDKMDMLILPGGAGHTLLDASNEVHALIAAICASPSIIGKKQILSGKKATCYPGFEKYCYGADMVPDKAVKDGLIITGKGPGAAAEFGFMVLTVLKGENTANSLRDEMQYND